MTDPIPRKGLRPRFWETTPLTEMTDREWEALCDGCGKCCLNKLEDEDTEEVALTCVACRLLDDATCRCSHYENRHAFVPDCIVLRPDNLDTHAYWMPATCAYRLLAEGRGLPDWHPLVSGDPGSVARAGIAMRNCTVPEYEVEEDELPDHMLEGML